MISAIYNKLNSISDIKKISNNAFWLFFDRILRLGVGLFVGVWIARYLGPLSFGKLNYSSALVALFSALSTLGLDQIIIKKIIDKPTEKHSLIGTAFFLRLGGSLIALLICCIYVHISDTDKTLLIITFLVSLSPVFSCFDVIDYEFQSKLQSRKTVIAKNIAFIMSTALKIFFVVKGYSLIYIVTAFITENLFGLFGLILFYKFQEICLWKFKFHLIKTLLTECWPLILSSIIILLYMRIDQVMIDKMLGHEAVGQYSVSVRITELWYFIPGILTSSLYPKLLSLKNDKVKYYKLTLLMLRALFAISFFIAMFVSFFSSQIVNVLFGKMYMQAAFALNISIWTGVFVFWGVGIGNMLIIENLNIHNFRKSIYGVVINIILNFILIPRFGINGAAVATLISQIFASYLYFSLQKSTRHIFYVQSKSILFLSINYV